MIETASARFGIPVDWIRVVMARESAGLTVRHGAPTVSSSGAMGLMQLMPATWSEMRLRYGLGLNPSDPHDNVFAGTAYLREMFDRFGYPALFAAYQAGPGRLERVLAAQSLLPPVTESYLHSIVPDAKIAADPMENPSANALFFVRSDTPNGSTRSRNVTGGTQSLFVPLTSLPQSRSR
jgi:soluble lytic murein transglycosylase-like protein